MIPVKLTKTMVSEDGDYSIKVFVPNEPHELGNFFKLEYKDPKLQEALYLMEIELESDVVVMDQNMEEYNAYPALTVMWLEACIERLKRKTLV